MAVKLNKVSYQDKLKNITYEFEDSKITSVLSSSGSGKTIFSYLISNIEKPTEGEIINTYSGRKIGYLFQNAEESFIFSTVREEILFGLRRYNYKIDNLEKRIEDSLKMVCLPLEYLDRNPFELSSGEKELLSLAVILSLNPKLLIIDEPTIYLDNKREEYLVKLLKKLKDSYNKTIIIFTSDVEFALKITDNYLLLKNGKISSKGTNKELLNDSDKIKKAGIEVPRIVEFINNVNNKKNIGLELTYDIKELMKDIYRNVK